MAKKISSNKRHIMMRYGMVSGFFLLLSLAIVITLFRTTISDAAEWNASAQKILDKLDTIQPERGNILAANGNILACNVRVYDIKLDLRHGKILNLKQINLTEVDSLADSLDRYYPILERDKHNPKQKVARSWRKKLREEIRNVEPNKRTRALRIVRGGSMEDYKRIAGFPFLKQFKGKGFRNPLYADGRDVRIYPYGKMASRSIGRVNEVIQGDTAVVNRLIRQNKKIPFRSEFHGYSGLEKDLDSLLYGQAGYSKKMPLTRGFSDWVTQAPRRGYDITTTIDISLQDILEEELQNVILKNNCKWGTAVLMEVETGEIKAISNLDRREDGECIEALNRAVLPFEPGSVMKPISLMIAFEDGLVRSVNDMVDCSPFQRTSDPHGGGMKSMKQVIEQSSNTGIARIIFRKYGKDPLAFRQRMEGLGFFEPLKTGIAGECVPYVPELKATRNGRPVTMTARHLDLARQAYGYNTMLPPMFTLSVYNAIANDGRYVRPHLVKSMRDEDGRDSVMPIQYIREHLCSPETARKVRECIAEVVWGEHGTARSVRSDLVKIAGKTGTVYPLEKGVYNKLKRRFAFAGFFPYERPKYSCIVVVECPGGSGAGMTSGQVVKGVAEKMYSRGMLDNSSDYRDGSKLTTPVLAANNSQDPQVLGTKLGVRNIKRVPLPNMEAANVMPNLKGCDAPTAVRLLESRGLKVTLRGSGHVRGQSVEPGTAVKRGSSVVVQLGM